MAYQAPAPDRPEEEDTHFESTSQSPRWGSNIKLIVGLTLAAIGFVLIIYFREIIGRLLLAFVLTYILHPVAAGLSRLTRLPWKVSVNIVFLVVLILLLGSLTASGLAIIQQITNLYEFVENFTTTQLPQIITDLSTRSYTVLFFTIDLSQLELETLSNRLLEYLQPTLTRLGSVVTDLATGAASTFGWGLFVIVIAYFLLSGVTGFQEDLIYINIPGYDADIRRLGRELRRVWNSFLRGQLIMFVLTILSYQVLLVILGVRFSLGIALMAGFARFIPYLGPLIVWIVLGLVSFFQSGNPYGLAPWQYSLLAIALGLLVDQIFDNLLMPRILGENLGLHPAAILVAAIIAANLLGLIGLVLAAPVLATILVVGRYMLRKMFDLDPWPMTEEEEIAARRKPKPRTVRRLQAWASTIRKRLF